MARSKRTRTKACFGSRVAALTVLCVLATGLLAPSVAQAAVSVSKATLSGTSLRVEGRGALASATVTVSSPESTASARADSAGRYKVSASAFRSSTCRATVADGSSSVVATLSGCTPAAAPSLSALSVSPTSVVGGAASTGTVTITSAAPTGGATMTLSDNSVATSLPANVTVPAGATSATFSVATSVVTAAALVTITAAASGVTRTTQITVNPTPTLAFFATATDMGPGFVGSNFVDTATGIGTTLGVSGYTGVVQFEIIVGQLPAGLTLINPGAGGATPDFPPMRSVSGVPTTVGITSFTLKATDTANGQTAQIVVTIIINAALGITLTPQLPWSAIVGSFANLWIEGAGGVRPYTWTRTAGTLPPGMTLVQDNPSGPLVRVTGTPTAAGTFTFTLRITDGQGAIGSQSFTATVG